MLASEIVVVIEANLKEKGIKKQDFYNACGISAAMMSNWRHDKNFPLLDTLAKINSFLGTNFILRSETDEKAPAAITDVSKIKQQAIDAIMNGTDEDAQMFLELLRVVQKKNPAG